jgi:aromatic-L-amino-acid/L-tryptophan decarboxylase
MSEQVNPSFDLSDDEFRRLGSQVVEMMHQAVLAEQSGPVMRHTSGSALHGILNEPLPSGEGTPEETFALWRDHIMPYCRRNGHPRFFGYVCTSADPLGMFADALASAVNQPVTAWRSAPSATEIERIAVKWLDQLTGFDGEGGLLVSGGSSANFHGLACAVSEAEHAAGLPSGSRHRLTAYLSREGHVSVRKALRLLGLPTENVRIIGIDENRRMRLDQLCRQIETDTEAGLIPAVVCASAGTANTGAIDQLLEIGAACQEYGIWYHIDGSYGAPAVITDHYSWMKSAFTHADSMSLDPHKWLFVPADTGCILIRDEAASCRAFSIASEYTAVTQTDPIEQYALFDHGLELSRRFRGLKVWTILRIRGLDKIRQAITHDIELNRYLYDRIQAHPHLEPMGSELSISCFRFIPNEKSTPVELNAINRRIVETIIEEGRCYMSPTELDGQYALRTCIVNFRTTREDIDFLVEEVLRIGGVSS